MGRLVGYGVSQVPTNGMLGGMAYQDPINVSVNILRVGPSGGNFQPGNGTNASLGVSGIFTGSYTPSGPLLSLYAKATVLGISNDAGVTENNSALIGFSCLNNSGFNSQAYFGAVSSPESGGDFGRGAVLVWGRRSGGNYTESMRISRTGNVGIGSTIPAATLDVNGYIKIGPTEGFNASPSVGGGPLLYRRSDGIIDSDSSTFLSNNSDSLSLWGLHLSASTIYGNGSALTLTTQNGNGTAQIEITNTTLQFKTGAAEAMRIDSSGRLNIGATGFINNPRLGVRGNNSLTGGNASVSSTNCGIVLSSTSGGTVDNAAGIWFDHGDLFCGISGSRVSTGNWGTDLRFYTHPDATSNQFTLPERMRIDSSGNVGIGSIQPAAGVRLDVLGGEIRAGRVDSSNEGGQLSFSRASDNATAWYIDVFGNTSTPVLRFVDATSSSVRATIDGSGNLLVGSTSGSAKTFINGDLKVAQTCIFSKTSQSSPIVFTISGASSGNLSGFFVLRASHSNFSGAYGGSGEWVYRYTGAASGNVSVLRSTTDGTAPVITVTNVNSTTFTVSVAFTFQQCVATIEVTQASNIS